MKCSFVQTLIPGPSIPLCERYIPKTCLFVLNGMRPEAFSARTLSKAACNEQWTSDKAKIKMYVYIFRYHLLFMADIHLTKSLKQ